MDKVGIKDSLEMVKMIEVTGVGAVKILADGKVNGKDFPVAVEMGKQYQVFIDGIQGADNILAEGKDIDAMELQELGLATYNAYKKIAEAKAAAQVA